MNFSTGTNRVFSINFAADVTWEVGNVKFKCIKIYISPFIMQGCSYVRNCGDVVKCIYAKSELLQKSMDQDEMLHNQVTYIAQSVTCLTTEACLTTEPGVTSSILVRSHTFMEIGHEIISKVILLQSAESLKMGCCYKRIFCMCTKYWLTA